MNNPTFTVILCEGYHDRAFLAGVGIYLLQWKEPGVDDRGNRSTVMDPFGRVAGGDFGYTHSSGARVRVRPCNGHSKIPDALKLLLNGRNTRPFDRLVINYDGDKGGAGSDFVERIHQSIEGELRRCGVTPVVVQPGHWTFDEGKREVRTIIWRCAHSEADPCDPTFLPSGIPEQQCLERLICTASASIWPERMAAVGQWLSSRPSPTTRASKDGTIPKSHTWTLMGGWFAEHGCDDFFKEVWAHPELANTLKDLLREAGTWEVLESCTQPVQLR